MCETFMTFDLVIEMNNDRYILFLNIYEKRNFLLHAKFILGFCLIFWILACIAPMSRNLRRTIEKVALSCRNIARIPVPMPTLMNMQWNWLREKIQQRNFSITWKKVCTIVRYRTVQTKRIIFQSITHLPIIKRSDHITFDRTVPGIRTLKTAMRLKNHHNM